MCERMQYADRAKKFVKLLHINADLCVMLLYETLCIWS